MIRGPRPRIVLIVDEHRFPLRIRDCQHLLEDISRLGIRVSEGPLDSFNRVRIVNVGPSRPRKENADGR